MSIIYQSSKNYLIQRMLFYILCCGYFDISLYIETKKFCDQKIKKHTTIFSQLQDIKEIIENCGHKHWGDRKEGLVGLQHFLSSGNTLTTAELRRVTDIFTKMFMDPHTKVFSLFLDTLNELLVTHNEDLGDWLYVLCARLLNKLGTDLLGSIQAKIHKTLDVVRYVWVIRSSSIDIRCFIKISLKCMYVVSCSETVFGAISFCQL